MTYDEAIRFLYSRLPMYQRVGASAYKASLDNIQKLCSYLGNPENKFPSVHIAGTNGKGSTSHTIAAILQSAGYQTGLYTSPHLKNFTERIRINGLEISQEYVTAFIDKHQTFIEQLAPSFFELTVGMAFSYFAACNVDIAVIEVGLGGRLDATNVITPLVSLITNIGYDHTDLLGDTLPQIASEKAGIIKTGVPAWVSQTQIPDVNNVFIEKAKACQTVLQFADKRIVCISQKDNTVSIYLDGSLWLDKVSMNLLGKHQLANLQGALSAIYQLKKIGYDIPDEVIKKGVENVTSLTGLLGRWQQIGEKPLVFCDVGHNKEGIEVVLEQIATYSYANLHIVLGMVKEKKHEEILALLPKNAIYYFCEPSVERKLTAAALQEKATAFQLYGTLIPDARQALQTAKQNASSNDLIWVGGSTFTVADVL